MPKGVISDPALTENKSVKHHLAPSSVSAVASADQALVTRQLKVLMVVECAGGGTGRHVLDLAQGLIQHGHEVHIAYSNNRVDQYFLDRLADLSIAGTVVLAMNAAPHPRDIKAIAMLRRYGREHGPFDIIHGHSSKGGAMARLAALGTGACAFYTLHGLIMMDPDLPRWKWLMYLGIELGLAQCTSRIIAVSPEEKRAAASLGLGDKRLIMIPNGVDQTGLVSRQQARRNLGVLGDEPVIGFVGRLVEQKAPHVLIEAFAQVLKVAPQARLAIVGNGPLSEPMQNLANTLRVNNRIIWLGQRDARQFFAGFDVFALSSRKEGLPYVVLEAMAAGLPVVATQTSGVEILVEPGVSGEVVQTDHVENFAQALSGLITNCRYRQTAADAARQRSQRFTIAGMVQQTLAAYRVVLGNNLQQG